MKIVPLEVGDRLTELNVFEAGRMMLPELERMLQNRYRMLQTIQTQGPIGRRMLADVLSRTEREIRNEMGVLQETELIQVFQKGMILTERGYEVLEQLKPYFYKVSGLAQKEKQLANQLGIEKVAIIPGNVDKDAATKAYLGKEASYILGERAKPKSIVAVTGGSSVASLRRNLIEAKPFNTMKFVAARGSMRNDVSHQANTLVSKFAKECGGQYHTLFLPEYLSEQAYALMMEEPTVKETVRLYDEANIVIHGIGTAMEMGRRRSMQEDSYQELLEKGAVGEAFGYYFDAEGNVVERIQTVGIQLEQVQQSELILAIAGGHTKAKAIEAYFKFAAKHTILITDEGAADEILASFNKSKSTD